MTSRTGHLLGFALGTLVLLTLVMGITNLRLAKDIYARNSNIHHAYTSTEQLTRDVESNLYQSGIFIRDFLLDNSGITAPMYRDELIQIRNSMTKDVENLAKSPQLDDARLIEQLRKEVDLYWDSMEPVLDWSLDQKRVLSSVFLRREVLPRRTAVLDMANEVKRLNELNLKRRQKQIEASMDDFRRSGKRSLVVIVSLGLVVAIFTIVRIARLEQSTQEHHIRTEQAEQELRRLSRQLVKAQEDERRRLSRELHDEVGQILTALRVGIGNLERADRKPGSSFHEHIEDAKGLAEQALKSVRNIATGLRPSVLDDFGLGPALQWQTRDFSRRTGIPVDLRIEGLPEDLPDAHRTSIYRAVQEGLTNCARHAKADRITIAVRQEASQLMVKIEDNGTGIQKPTNGTVAQPGLGLVGMEERIRELGGTVEIQSAKGKGTLLKILIPALQEQKV
jgi:signal transduction histidine kinase